MEIEACPSKSMSAAVHILCGPVASGKTSRLLDCFRATTFTATGAGLWLGPTHRAVEAVRERVLHQPALLGLHSLTFQDFVEEIICVNDPKAWPLSNVQRCLLSDDLLTELHHRGELSHVQRVLVGFGVVAAWLITLVPLMRCSTSLIELPGIALGRRIVRACGLDSQTPRV
jgi:hypothetical protein